MSDAETVKEVLGRGDLARLMVRVRDRLEANGIEVAGTVSIPDASQAERRALGRLLGVPPPSAAAPRVSLERLDAVLRASRLRVGVVEASEALAGPLTDRRAERLDRDARRALLWGNAAAHRAHVRHPGLDAWLTRLRKTGLLSRVAKGNATVVLSRTLDGLDRLPAGGMRLPVFATQLAGDAHALDRNRPVGIVIVSALAHLTGLDHPSDAESWRAVWGRFGIACDDLSCDVLTLGLRPNGSPAAGAVATLSDAGEPARVTLRQLLRDGWAITEERLWVCENPVVVAEAADRLGKSCAPVVCVAGVPSTAALAVLTRAVESGATLAYHGDFDWPGIRIAKRVAACVPVEPWRYRAADYRSVNLGTPAVPLAGDSVETPWDPDLGREMEERGIAVFEEQVIEDLVADLART